MEEVVTPSWTVPMPVRIVTGRSSNSAGIVGTRWDEWSSWGRARTRASPMAATWKVVIVRRRSWYVRPRIGVQRPGRPAQGLRSGPDDECGLHRVMIRKRPRTGNDSRPLRLRLPAFIGKAAVEIPRPD